MGKEILTFEDFEIRKNKFYPHESSIFLDDEDIEKVLASNKIFSNEKNYKYFMVYLYNDHKVKPVHVMHPIKSTYVEFYDGHTKWMYFLIENDDWSENIMLFGIKPVLISKKNLIASLSKIKRIWKPIQNLMGMKL